MRIVRLRPYYALFWSTVKNPPQNLRFLGKITQVMTFGWLLDLRPKSKQSKGVGHF